MSHKLSGCINIDAREVGHRYCLVSYNPDDGTYNLRLGFAPTDDVNDPEKSSFGCIGLTRHQLEEIVKKCNRQLDLTAKK